MRKRKNALRRRYQRTSNEEQRENRKNQYTKDKKEYQAAIKKEIMSWKKYCTTTSPKNPWNEIYKLANNKTRSKQIITTIQKPDGTKTETMTETLQLILHKLIPEDKHKEDTPYHRTIQDQTKQPLHTMDDKEFTNKKLSRSLKASDRRKHRDLMELQKK
jgi:hypothetical protein